MNGPRQDDPWHITLFGGLRAQRGEQVITRFTTQKVASLFAYLAYYLRQAHSREILIELLWPDSHVPTLRNSLSVSLSSLRNQFEPPGVLQGAVLRADRFSVGLNPATVTTDVARFEQALKAAAKAGSRTEREQHLTEAVELYQGPLLPGFYEEWIAGEQERLSGLFFDAVGTLVNHLEGIGDIRTALSYARHAVAVDPLREAGQQHLIRLLAADGQPGTALRQYKEYERLLEDELGEEPSAALRALFRRVEKESGLFVPPSVAATVVPPKLATLSPSGGSDRPATMTFLMSDIMGSTRLVQQAPDAYGVARERHHCLLRQAFVQHGGQEIKETGDGFVVAFASGRIALACAVACQKALAEEAWPEGIDSLTVRMALHTGDVQQDEARESQGIVLHHASRMLTAAHGGQILVSETTAGIVPTETIAAEGIQLSDLGVYRLRDVPEARHLFQAHWPEMGKSDFGPLAAQTGHLSNVPVRFTRFFGREKEIGQLCDLLGTPGVRLVTVSGPGGNGKTRLSLEVAERLSDAFAGGVYFVPLADLSDPALIAGAILDSLHVKRSPHKEPLAQAAETLARKPTLLVLDNFEQLVEGGAEVVQTLLSGVPSLKALITSRQLLGLSAEREYTLSPLPVPGGEETAEQLSVFESVQLFIDRAQQVKPDFQVSNANAAAVAALAMGLEGIPLAIELAAARAQVLTPSQMVSQLSNRFEFLASRKRDMSERHRTLRGAIDWSFRLLSPELQRFFCRLSVFRGGWTIEAAESVCEEPLALDYLAQLRECSMVLSEAAGAGMRFRMLETLREFGREQLSPEEGPLLQRRHADFFCGIISELGILRFHTLPEEERQNIWLALWWYLRNDGPTALRVAAYDQTMHCFQTRGYFREGREWLDEVLNLPEAAGATSDRAAVLRCVEKLEHRRGNFDEVLPFIEESLFICRRLDDRVGVAHSLNSLGNYMNKRGNYADAQRYYEESLLLFREQGREGTIAMVLLNLGILALTQGDLETGDSLFLESSTYYAIQNKKDRTGLVQPYPIYERGQIAYYRGDYQSARMLLEEALFHWRSLNYGVQIGTTLTHLSKVACRSGDPAKARSSLKEGIALWRDLGVELFQDESSLMAASLLAFAEGQKKRAACLLGVIRACVERKDFFLSPIAEQEIAAWRTVVHETLGEEAFTSALEEGRIMNREQAAVFAFHGDATRG